MEKTEKNRCKSYEKCVLHYPQKYYKPYYRFRLSVARNGILFENFFVTKRNIFKKVLDKKQHLWYNVHVIESKRLRNVFFDLGETKMRRNFTMKEQNDGELAASSFNENAWKNYCNIECTIYKTDVDEYTCISNIIGTHYDLDFEALEQLFDYEEEAEDEEDIPFELTAYGRFCKMCDEIASTASEQQLKDIFEFAKNPAHKTSTIRQLKAQLNCSWRELDSIAENIRHFHMAEKDEQ